MAKALKTAALVVGAVALVATGVGAVALGGLAGAVTIGGVSASTLFLVSGGLTAASSLLQKTPKVPAAQTDRLNASVDPRAFRKTVLGQTAMPVEIRYEEWSGKDQEYCDWIVLHASHASDGLEEIWFDTEMAWSATTGVVGKWAGYFSVPHIVLEGSAANAFSIGSGQWNRSARLTGCTYSHWRFKVTGNGKKAESPFSSGLPSRITVIGRGAKLYDPRRDSTVPGGSGPMRAADQSTWRYTADDGAVIGENLALHTLRVALGWRIKNPVTGEMRLATGSGVPARRLNLQSWIVAANVADEQVNRSAGGTEPRYHGACVISEGDDPKSSLDMLCTACCGRFRDTAGKLSFTIAHNDLAGAATDDGLNTDDVVGPFTWDPDAALEATPNIARGKYVDASVNSLYQMIDYPEVRLPSPDGQDRIFPLDLGAVESPSQAQRIAKQVLQRKQYPRRFSAPFDIRAWKYSVGDVVPFTFAPLGFTRALFRVEEQELGQGGTCNMTLLVENASLYAWDKDDAAPVQAAAPIVYDNRKNPLVLAIDDAGKTAEWPNVGDPAGTKPDDNATNSADPESAFGPGGTVGGALLRFDQIDEAIENVRDEVGGAEGLTQAAIDARDAARLAATNSATARDESQAARDAASTASGQALSSAKAAAGSAGTAEGQATIASTKATTATEQASIATAKATVATTKAGEASTSASNAATSEQNAGGSATAAATSAKTAADASDAAGRSASAASTSQSSAAASAGDAGQKASAAAESATSAGTSAGQASTSAGQAATSATNASGSATVASIAATVSASSASGDLVKHGNFADGNSGYWPVGPYETRMIRPRDYGQTLPPGQEWVYLMRGYRDALEEYGWNGGVGNGAPNAGRIAGDWGNRVIRVEALASAEFSPNDAACGFFGYGADGSILQFGGVTAAVAGVAGYRSIKSDIVVSAGVVKIVPWLQNNGPPGFETQEGRWARFSLRDVTEEVRAGQSASAAAGSATTAGTRADDAGRSASAAQTSYTNAEASNRGAAASAQSAAGWASAADGSRASAASYAEQAASFRDQAGGSAASAKSSADAAASSTGALSQRVDQVEIDVGGAKSNASSALTAVGDVKTGLAGARVQFIAQSPGGRAIFSLVSDNVSGAQWQLGGDGLIDGNLMLTGSLTGPKIAPNAISGTASVEGGSLALRNTALTDAASVGYTGNGGRASITFSGIVTLSPGAAAGTRMQAYLFINGNTKIGPLPISAQRGSPAPFCFTTLADISGQVTVTLSVQATNGSGSGDPHLVDNPTIILLEMKKLGG